MDPVVIVPRVWSRRWWCGMLAVVGVLLGTVFAGVAAYGQPSPRSVPTASDAMGTCAGARWQPTAGLLASSQDPDVRARDAAGIAACVSAVTGSPISLVDGQLQTAAGDTIATLHPVETGTPLPALPLWRASVAHTQAAAANNIVWRTQLETAYQTQRTEAIRRVGDPGEVDRLRWKWLEIGTVVVMLLAAGAAIGGGRWSALEGLARALMVGIVGVLLLLVVVDWRWSGVQEARTQAVRDAVDGATSVEAYLANAGYREDVTGEMVYATIGDQARACIPDDTKVTIDPEQAAIHVPDTATGQHITTCLNPDLTKLPDGQVVWTIPVPVPTGGYHVTWQLTLPQPETTVD